MYQVIDGRYNEVKPTILISNSKNPVEGGFLDMRTIDRLNTVVEAIKTSVVIGIRVATKATRTGKITGLHSKINLVIMCLDKMI